jgi:hypothetical protein
MALDIALTSLKCSFVVVPCCVFPGEFEGRRFEGHRVKKYSTFIKYLCAKDPSIAVARLPFKGRNVCLYKIA